MTSRRCSNLVEVQCAPHNHIEVYNECQNRLRDLKRFNFKTTLCLVKFTHTCTEGKNIYIGV